MIELTTEIYRSISEVNSNQWNNIVDQSDNGSIYNTTRWIKAVEKTHDVEGRHIIVKKSGNPIGIFPNFKVRMRLPYSIKGKLPVKRLIPYELASINVGYGGPIIQSNESDTFRAIIKAVESAVDWNTISHYIRPADHDHVRYNEILNEYNYIPNVSRCRFEIPLENDFQSIYFQMDKDRRYDLRNGYERDPITMEEKITEKTINQFYMDYLDVMDRVNGDPKSKKFFKLLSDLLGDSVKIFKTVIDGETVGRNLYIIDDNKNSIRHEISAVPEHYFQYRSSELIQEHVMQWGAANGYSFLDLGPTPSDYRDGLFKYKEKYGGQLRPIITWEKRQSLLWPFYKQARSFYKRHILQ